MGSLKISLIVGDLSASGAGRWGGAVRPFLLTQALKKLGHSVEIVGFIPDKGSATIYPKDVAIHTIHARQYPFFLQSAYQLLKKLKGDVIYAYKLKPTSFGLGLIKKSLSSKPLILDIDDWEMSWHGGCDFHYQPSPKQFARDLLKPHGALHNPDHPLYLKWIERWVPHADQITIHTTFLQNKFGGICVPNGKDLNLFNPAQYNADESRKKYGLDAYRILMFPGAPRPYKGLEDILIALDMLNDDNLRLVIVGGSPYDDYDKKLRKKWGKWIIQLPKSSYEVMPEIVSAAHVIVVPQRDTPAAKAQFPLKLTDGMAMAKPILTTDVGDIPTILGDTGYIAKASHPKELAEKIGYIFQNLNEANMKGKLARQRCIEHYSIESMATRLSEVLELKVTAYSNPK